jgi:uncharacterized protein (DUF885 family)
MGISGYDDAVPDLSPGCQQAWRDHLVSIVVRSDQYRADVIDGESRTLLSVVRDNAIRSLAVADSRVEEFTVTTFPSDGPSVVLLDASRKRLPDEASAVAYLTRCRRLPAYLDQYTERLRNAARAGLLPVAPLVQDVISQLRDYLSRPEGDPMLSPAPPERWGGAAAWRDELNQVIRDEFRSAIGRYVDLLTELLPASRPPEKAGLLHVPGGVAAYGCWVRFGTTLPLDPEEIHQTGLEALAELEDRIAQLGSHIMGIQDIGELMARLRAEASSVNSASGDPITRAAAAIARVEGRLAELFHSPIPPPCSIDPMPQHMMEFGSPPFYSPPARDGSRAGAYLFNSLHPGLAGSWALEATAFHEAVPGHHVQFARQQAMAHLPLLLTAFYSVPHGEGWGLYAEQLADEFGFYSDDMQRLGMLSCASWRAVRLIVDTGLHARGWSRARARDFALAHSPMPESFVSAEVDRYIAVPGQALGYLTGQREILRLRDYARSRLGASFDIRDFHSAVLDHGSLPLPVLRQVVEEWVAAQQEMNVSTP